MPRPRRYRDNAHRQAAYRQRKRTATLPAPTPDTVEIFLVGLALGLLIGRGTARPPVENTWVLSC
jgi:hypothetical protein